MWPRVFSSAFSDLKVKTVVYFKKFPGAQFSFLLCCHKIVYPYPELFCPGVLLGELLRFSKTCFFFLRTSSQFFTCSSVALVAQATARRPYSRGKRFPREKRGNPLPHQCSSPSCFSYKTSKDNKSQKEIC